MRFRAVLVVLGALLSFLGASVLSERAAHIEKARQANEFTIPTTIGLEKQTNPYMRVADAGIRKYLGLESATDADVFAEIRTRKDNF